jgi:puromycin-sensitive aminopeptidase
MAAAPRKKRDRLRLDPGVRPSRVAVHVEVDPSRGTRFRGVVCIDVKLDRRRSAIRLHAADLRVTRPRVRCADGVRRATLTLLPDLEMVEIGFDRPLPAGDAQLELAFAGRLRGDLCGLYAARSGERRYAVTQLEATDARKFFPCFDEPAMKARFEMSVTTGSANQVIANAPVARTRRHGDGTKTVHFEPTPPLSTYLVALAVGELEGSKPVCVGPTRIRVWHTPGKRRLTGFALECARECLTRLERYFGVPYPYAKLDLVAVPDFEFGAMENAGAIFFRETLLLIDPTRATLAEKKRAAEVICHELAHMWYGDLVTMAWWDDLWLNESFATWMAFVIVDQWRPEWRMWLDFQHGTAAALELDALRNTHPIYCEVRSAAEASENFDLITYEKGAAVVRMLERYLGPAVFRRGVRSYIRRHREGNAVAADLWRALSEASGEDVETLARAWIEQPGHPVLEIRQYRERGRSVLRVRQQRFTEAPARKRAKASGAASPAKAGRWPIPWVVRVGSGARGRTRLERRLLSRVREEVKLSGPAPRFVYGNGDESGFFRPLHGATEFRAILKSIAALPTVERMGLVDHQWALARAGRAPIESVLDLAETLAGEADADVLAALCKPLRFIGRALVPVAGPDSRERYRDWLVGRFGPAFAELGWDSPRGEPDALRLRRATLLTIVGGIAGDEATLHTATERCARYLSHPRSLDANLSDGVVSLAARVGDPALHERFCAASASAATPQEERRFLLALADFRLPALVDRTLRMTLSDAVPTQDVIFVLARLLMNPDANERCWSFVQKRWPRLRRKVPSLLASRLIDATPALLTPTHRREVARFFRANPVPSGERALRQALERFDSTARFRRSAARPLTRWLQDPAREA